MQPREYILTAQEYARKRLIKWAKSQENLSSGSPTRWDSNLPAQRHKLARVLKFGYNN